MQSRNWVKILSCICFFSRGIFGLSSLKSLANLSLEESVAIHEKVSADRKILSSKKIERVVIILGHATEGKSAFVNLMALRELKGKKISGIPRVDVEKPVQGMDINHDGAHVTTVPYQKYDHRSKSVFYDTPGLLPTDNPQSFVRNYLIIQRIFTEFAQYPKYIMIVISENNIQQDTGAWINSLNHLACLFGNCIEDLAGSLCLVVTKSHYWFHDTRGEEHARALLIERTEQFRESLKKTTSTVHNKMHELLQASAQAPLIFIPAPVTEGVMFNLENCDALRSKIVRSILQTRPITALVPVPLEAQWIRDFVGELNESLNRNSRETVKRVILEYGKLVAKQEQAPEHVLRNLVKKLEFMEAYPDLFYQEIKELLTMVNYPYRPLDLSNVASSITYSKFLQVFNVNCAWQEWDKVFKEIRTSLVVIIQKLANNEPIE